MNLKQQQPQPVPRSLAAAAAALPVPLPAAPFRAHMDRLTKPVGALGRLEDLAVQMQQLGLGDLRKAVYVFAADHGLAAEAISAYPSAVTRQMVQNFLTGGAAMNVLARLHGASVRVVDAGVLHAPAGTDGFAADPALLAAPVRSGSRNMLHEAAMSAEEFDEALRLGLQCSADAASRGYTLVAVGEMGIGNTASAAAIAATLTGLPVAEVTGRGTGVEGERLRHKVDVLRRVLAFHGDALGPAAETLRRVGGLELAAMAAFMIGCASAGMGVVVDGFISTAAAACALGMCPALSPFLFAGHQSEEPGHAALLRHCGLRPILSLGMRLGEGTGAILAMPVLESALRLSNEMATFASAGVSGASEPVPSGSAA